jgi:uncharacterized protein (TIGR02001 family)
MKLVSLIVIAAVAASAGSALAADLPSTKAPVVAAPVVVSPWDFDIGAGLTTDYLFRGITQSNHQPSVAAHGELRYNVDSTWQLYAGISGESIKFSPNYYPAGSPAMELDGDAGIRGTFDKFSFDLGGIIYGYPDTPTGVHVAYFGGALQPIGLSPRTDTWGEVYIKPSYTVNDTLTVGANFFYTPSYINTGANGEYLSGTAKVTAPGDFSWLAASGEIGYQWLGRVNNVYTGNNFPFNYVYTAGGYGGYAVGQLPSYLYGNIGLSGTYKFVTLDLRFYGTNLSKSAAYQLTGIPDSCSPACSSTSKYGQDAFVATLSFDLTSKDLK